MFGALRRSARTAPDDDSGSTADLTWDALRQASSTDLLSVIDAAAESQLQPHAFADLSLADLAMLLPNVQPAQLLKFRLALAGPPVSAPRKSKKGVTRPPGMAVSSFFFSNLLSHGPSGIGNDRLALWFEVTLVMATLLFSLALSLTLSPPVTCANPDDASWCASLILADQIIWCVMAFLLWTGAFMVWCTFLVILVCSAEDAKHFFATNIRVCCSGILSTIVGVLLFGPGIALRVVIVSASRAPQYVAISVMCSFFAFINVAIIVLMGATGVDTWKETFVAFLGGFGLLPGTNRLREA